MTLFENLSNQFGYFDRDRDRSPMWNMALIPTKKLFRSISHLLFTTLDYYFQIQGKKIC